jgi:general secretion pathway protein J
MVRAIPGTARESGYTLLEMLVSLALLGLVAGMILAGTGQAGRAVARMRGEGDRETEIVQAQRLLRTRIERMSTIARTDSAEPIVDAQGQSSEFEFVAPALERDQPVGLVRYRVLLTPTRDLVLFSAHPLSLRADSGGTVTGWKAVRLLSGATRLAISYLGPDRRDGIRRWQAFWAGRSEAPEVVRIDVGFPPGDRRTWPSLMVRPRATNGAECKIDAVTARCGAAG